MTWLKTSTGTEISAVTGLMTNTQNPDTNYESGSEFHLDFMLNQFLAENFAIGFHGYHYNQFTGDTGSGARLGSFEGESVGIGPALLWQPKVFDGHVSLLASWLHDLASTRRLEGDYGVVTVSFDF